MNIFCRLLCRLRTCDWCRFALNPGLPRFVWRSVNLIGIIRALRSSGPALPHIARLIVFNRLIRPSA
jgi:hypothetical protein